MWNDEIKRVIERSIKLGMQIMPYYLCYENGILKPKAGQLQKNNNDSYDIIFA